MLNHSLDPGSTTILETAKLSDPNIDFSTFWARLEMEMGSEDPEEIRGKWHALRLKHQGTLRLNDWRTFVGEFFRLKVLVEGNEEEAKAILMRVLPVEFRRKVLQEEDKKAQGRLVVSGLGSLTEH